MKFSDFIPIKPNPVDILKHRTDGEIYCGDFPGGTGKYISTTIKSDEPVDAILKISPRIELRFTYIFDKDHVKGLQISKLSSDGSMEKIHLSTLDWQGILNLLKIFEEVDFNTIARGSVVLDKTLIDDSEGLKKFLGTVATDPQGKEKFAEVAKNFGLLAPADVSTAIKRRDGVNKFKSLLNSPDYFSKVKDTLNIRKDEEVWQKYFQQNDWLLGSDVVEILDERVIDEHNIVDLPIKSTDGFLDIIELKLPGASVWTAENNPSAELTKSIMQCIRYINEIEKRANDHVKIEALGIDIVKPRVTLIYGRNTGWTSDQKKQLRILNSSFHNITILSYDHMLQRAIKLAGVDNEI